MYGSSELVSGSEIKSAINTFLNPAFKLRYTRSPFDLWVDTDRIWLRLEHVDAWRVCEHFVPGLRGGHARRRHRLTRSLFEP
jgi:hypothetical protein